MVFMWERLKSCAICLSSNERDRRDDQKIDNFENNIKIVPNIRWVTVKLIMLHILLTNFELTQLDGFQHLYTRRHWKYGLYSVRNSQKD